MGCWALELRSWRPIFFLWKISRDHMMRKALKKITRLNFLNLASPKCGKTAVWIWMKTLFVKVLVPWDASPSFSCFFFLFLCLICILPSHFWRFDSISTVHPDSVSFLSRLPFGLIWGGKKTQTGAHHIQLTAQQILETRISDSEVFSVNNSWFSEASNSPPGCVFTDVLAH